MMYTCCNPIKSFQVTPYANRIFSSLFMIELVPREERWFTRVVAPRTQPGTSKCLTLKSNPWLPSAGTKKETKKGWHGFRRRYEWAVTWTRCDTWVRVWFWWNWESHGSAMIDILLLHNRDKPSLDVFHIHMVLNTTCLASWPERPCWWLRITLWLQSPPLISPQVEPGFCPQPPLGPPWSEAQEFQLWQDPRSLGLPRWAGWYNPEVMPTARTSADGKTEGCKDAGT